VSAADELNKKMNSFGKSGAAARQPGGRPGGPGGYRDGPPAQLPKGYLDGGYFDDKGSVRKELIIDWAEQLARTFKDNGLYPSAMRNFFNKARAIESSPDFEKNFSNLREQVYAFVPLAAYQVGRKVVPECFGKFIEKNVSLATKDPTSYSRGFVQHFKCVLAYFVGFGGEKGGSR